MAKPEHIALLKRSVADWNQWRRVNPDVLPDLSQGNLKKIKCPQANLMGANLSGANLFKADLRGSNFQGADLQGAKLLMTNLQEANLKGANLQMASLLMANLQRANLQNANLSKAEFRRTNLLKADLRGTNLIKAGNLTCEQLGSVMAIDKNTQFPRYLKVNIIDDNKWACKESKWKVYRR